MAIKFKKLDKEGENLSLQEFITIKNTLAELFYNCNTIQEWNFLAKLNFSKYTDCTKMFYGCNKLIELPTLTLNSSVSCYQMFYGCSNLKNFNVNLAPTSVYGMFSSCNSLEKIGNLDLTNIYELTETFRYNYNLQELNVTFGNLKYMKRAFQGCKNLKAIPDFNGEITADTYITDYLQSTFENCHLIQRIATLNLKNIAKDASCNSMLYGCKSLCDLIIKNIRINIRIASGNGTGENDYGCLLTLDSLINTCKECINVEAARTLTVGTANLEKLSTVYVRLTNTPEEDETLPKLPCEVCESTDDGAMLINDYLALKNWTLV